MDRRTLASRGGKVADIGSRKKSRVKEEFSISQIGRLLVSLSKQVVECGFLTFRTGKLGELQPRRLK